MPDEYTVVFSSRAKREMNRLPLPVAAGIYERLMGPVAENPYRLGKPLNPPYDEVWSTRRGEYRALYRIDDDTRTVTVASVGHRRAVYRPR